MILLTEYYKSQNSERDKEYLTCINQNINNTSIKKVIIFISDDSELSIIHEKIQIVKDVKRPSFLDLFDYCNKNLQDEICIISNTDIFFDDTLNNLKDFNFENQFISLTRWDLLFDGSKWSIRFYDFPWNNGWTTAMFSQDSWLFKSPIKTDNRLDFLMGKPGCDNRISQIIHELGYNVSNPSKKIITKHLHQSNIRTYTHQETILGPYLLIKPTEKLDEKAELLTIKNF
jgi:hypothetical protein